MEEEEHTKKNPRNQEKKRVPIGKQFHTSSMFKCQLPQYFLCYLKFFTILIFWCLFSPCSFFFYFSIWLSCMMMMKNDLIRKAKKKSVIRLQCWWCEIIFFLLCLAPSFAGYHSSFASRLHYRYHYETSTAVSKLGSRTDERSRRW